MFKIIITDNYNRGTRSDRLLIPRIASKETAIVVCTLLRNDPARADADWYEVVPAQQPLYIFDPNE